MHADHERKINIRVIVRVCVALNRSVTVNVTGIVAVLIASSGTVSVSVVVGPVLVVRLT